MRDSAWRLVSKSDHGCWIWHGTINHSGYGIYGKPSILAHRMVYEAVVGSIPAGLQIDHLCRVRNCVNPSHLDPVTLQENIRRGQTGKHQTKRTHCPHGHEYTDENTYHRKDKTGRICRTCSRDRMRRSRMLPQEANLAGDDSGDRVHEDGST